MKPVPKTPADLVNRIIECFPKAKFERIERLECDVLIHPRRYTVQGGYPSLLVGETVRGRMLIGTQFSDWVCGVLNGYRRDDSGKFVWEVEKSAIELAEGKQASEIPW